VFLNKIIHGIRENLLAFVEGRAENRIFYMSQQALSAGIIQNSACWKLFRNGRKACSANKGQKLSLFWKN
jgi:hypothetical protein